MRGQPQIFFQELLALCRKHKVNIEMDGNFIFHLDDNFHRKIEFHNVNVTGAWDIRPEYAAASASRVNRPALYEELEIPGTGIGDTEEEEEEFILYGADS